MSGHDQRPGALDDLRVVDLSGEIGVYAGKVLTNLGAEVVRVVPPGGDPLSYRSPFAGADRDPRRSLYATHYNAGKRVLTLDLESDPGRDRLRALFAGADILLESYAPSEATRLGLTPDELLRLNPGLVVTSITPFGRTGPWAEYRGTDLIGFASGGMLTLTGEPDGPPVRIGGEQAYHFVGLQAVAGTLAAILHRAVSGRGQHVDVSMQAAIAAAYLDTGITYYQMNDAVPRRNGTQHILAVPFVALPCADGYFHWGALEAHHWRSLVQWVGESLDVEVLEDPTLERVLERLPFMDYVNAILTEFGSTRTKAELFGGAQQRRLPATPVKTVSDLLQDPHLLARDFFTEVEAPAFGGTLKDAGSPFRMSETPGQVRRPVPVAGDQADGFATRNQPPPNGTIGRERGRAAGAPRALDGIRVLDFTWAVAGPMITRVLAAHGAEVLKVESGVRHDAMRLLAQHQEKAGGYVNVNAGKRSFTVDLTQPEGIDLIKRLVALCDVVVENFSPRVMPNLGLDYDALRQIRSDIILLSLPGFGDTGPYRNYVSYGPNIMSISGLTNLTGYPDNRPTGVTFGYGDYVGGAHGVVAILAALHYRDRTGRGQYINLAQYEAAVNFLGSAIVEATATGREPVRNGNRSPDAVPHGVYPCAGEDRWCAIVAPDDAAWQRFANLIKRPDLANDAGLRTLAGRQAREAEIDAAITAWAAAREAEDVMAACQAADLPAAVVANVVDLLDRDPQMSARGYYEPVEHPNLPGMRVDGASFRLSETPGGFRGAGGPLLGEANDYVYRDLLGLSDEEIRRLMDAKVINRHLAPWIAEGE